MTAIQDPVHQSLFVLEQTFCKDVFELICSFPETANALNDQLALTKRLISEPTLPTLIGHDLWPELVSSAYTQTSELDYHLGILSSLRLVLGVAGVIRLVKHSPEYQSVLTANQNLALAIVQDGRCANWLHKDLWLSLAAVANGNMDQDGSTERSCPQSPSIRRPASAEINRQEAIKRTDVLRDLAIQYMSDGQYEVGIPLCNQALDEIKNVKGSAHLDAAKLLTVLALVYRDQSEFQKSADLLMETLAIRSRALGDHHKDVASTLNNLGVLYSVWGKYKEAEPFLIRALDVRERIFGEDHPAVGNQLNNLAFLCRNLGHYTAGIEYSQRALEIFENYLKPESPEMAKKAFVCIKQKKYKEAENLYCLLFTFAKQRFSECKNADSLQPERQNSNPDEDPDYLVPNTSETTHNDSSDLTTVSCVATVKTMRNMAAFYHLKRKYKAAKALEKCFHSSK